MLENPMILIVMGAIIVSAIISIIKDSMLENISIGIIIFLIIAAIIDYFNE